MLDERFYAAINDLMADLRTKLRDSQTDQGHTLSGRLRDSIDYEISSSKDKISAKMEMEDYGAIVEFGVKPSRIPFSGRSGNGGTSKYIQGLISFFEKRGLDEDDAKRAAFATAYVHKREGFPTKASSKYSKTGERTGFIRTVLKSEMDVIKEAISANFGLSVYFLFEEYFKDFENLKTEK